MTGSFHEVLTRHGFTPSPYMTGMAVAQRNGHPSAHHGSGHLLYHNDQGHVVHIENNYKWTHSLLSNIYPEDHPMDKVAQQRGTGCHSLDRRLSSIIKHESTDEAAYSQEAKGRDFASGTRKLILNLRNAYDKYESVDDVIQSVVDGRSIDEVIDSITEITLLD